MSQGFFFTLVITSITIGTHIRHAAVRRGELVAVRPYNEVYICANTSFGDTDKAVALMTQRIRNLLKALEMALRMKAERETRN